MPDRGPQVKKTKITPQKGAAGSARQTALEVLHQLFQHPEDGTPLPVMLARASQAAGLSARDAALLSELVYGVLRRHALLDSLLAAFLRKPGALSSQVGMTLRLGLYELLFMDSIPARATVSEYVALARRRFGQGVGGLVNGVLRSADREADVLREKAAQAAPAEAASIPAWLMSLWEAQFGTEAAAGFASNTLAHAAPCWRVNMAKDGAAAFRDERLASGYAAVGREGFTSFGLEKPREDAQQELSDLARLEEQGVLSRQGVSSQLVAEHIAARVLQHPALREAPLWDSCCGRGGKSLALLEKGVRVSLASDPAQFRVDELLASARRLGLTAPETVCAPAQDVDAEFPLILIDVPCSGTGTLGRVPELRLRLTPEKLNEAERLQGEILEHAWACLQPGGLLFYVTCALNRKENEGRIARFLAVHGEEKGGEARLCEQRLFLPELPGHDALFLAVLEKLAR